jgi:diacylglycerol O-acyltransferase
LLRIARGGKHLIAGRQSRFGDVATETAGATGDEPDLGQDGQLLDAASWPDVWEARRLRGRHWGWFEQQSWFCGTQHVSILPAAGFLSAYSADNPPVSNHAQPRRIPGRDVHFFYEERATQPMHTLKLLTFELEPGGPALGLSDVREALGARIRTLAPLRRRLQRVPLGLFHPVWVDAGEPDLDVHVRAVAVQAPGGRRELGQLLSRLAMAPLDRSRPLWELWLIEGLPEGQMALALKLHHTVADGNSSARIIAHLLGGKSQAELVAHEQDPSPRELLAGALPELARTLARSGSILRRARRAGAAAGEVRRSQSVRMAKPFTGPAMPWSERPTMRRTFGYVSLDLADLQAVQDAGSCTSAELVLTLLGGALRSYLADRGLPAGARLSATVPVSVRASDQRAEWGNHVGNVFVELGGELSDPLERLHAISATMSAVRTGASWTWSNGTICGSSIR